MRIRTLTVQGFRSFQAQQQVDFTKLRPGLYHLAGRNEVEPELEGNGAGKSSLLEAICWGLYGRTSRGLKAGAVKSWGSFEKCAVILDVETAAGEIGIFRVWNPNTLEVSVNGGDPRPVDQKALDALLGLSPEAFLFSIYFSQFSPAFIDLRPAEQMAVYSAVLGLDLWAAAAERAGKVSREKEAKVATHRETCARLEGQVGELEKLDFAKAEREWGLAQAIKIREAEASLLNLAREVPALQEAAIKAEERNAAMLRAKAAEAEAAAELRGAEKLLAAGSGQLEKLQAAVENGTCPVCGSKKLTKAHVEGEIQTAQKGVEKDQAAVERARKKHAEAKKKEMEFGSVLGGRKEVAKWSEAKRGLEAADQEISRLKDERNPYTAQRVEVEDKLARLNAEAEREVAELEKAELARTSSAFWAKGFKELRLSLIEESLAQLAIESNSSLVSLGLKAWGLDFDVERETKAGGVSKGFTVSVQAPHVREPVPWEAWSGGESQRLRVAASLGFGELICSRMGLQPNVEFWDEPSTWLSEAGIHDLLSALEERARNRGKVILLADHRALDFGGFAGSFMVTKKKTGSQIELVV